MMANERKMTPRYQVKIDKMTSIDINIILVYLPNNNNSSNKIMKDNQTSKNLPLTTAGKKNFNNRVNSIVHDKMVPYPLFVFLYLFFACVCVCECALFAKRSKTYIRCHSIYQILEMTLRVELTNGMLFDLPLN